MTWIERVWRDRSAWTLALRPAATLFGIIVRLRRRLYALGVLRTHRLPVPVVVIGNIRVGGTGKTPLIVWLCQWLREHGLQPGIIARGYGGDGQLHEVRADSDARLVGDEPLLLARRCDVPVVVSPRRFQAASHLLARHPRCDVILSDDGLQHYAMARDLEIAVVDGERGHGNGMLLPAGPLREPLERLETVDAVVVNGAAASPVGKRSFAMTLRGDRFVSVTQPTQHRTAPEFGSRRTHAVAGIGDPDRFFRHLRALGLNPQTRSFSDHHRFTPADLAFAGDDIVLMTEKDAVKCAAFARPNWWYLPVDAVVDAALGELILAKLRHRHGS